MNFCSHSGSSALEHRIPEGDTLPRWICSNCGTVHYQNPKVVVGCLPEWNGQVLLCKRAIEPRYGLWTLPAGVLGYRETRAAGAASGTPAASHAGPGRPRLVTPLCPAPPPPGTTAVSPSSLSLRV